LGAVLFCLGGFSVCALHGGGSRLLLHYQLFRKPAVIFSFFLPVSHAKGYPIVTGVTCTCNFCCFLMCINQLLEKSKQLCIYLLLSVSYRHYSVFYSIGCRMYVAFTCLSEDSIYSCSRVQEKRGGNDDSHTVKMYNVQQMVTVCIYNVYYQNSKVVYSL